MFHDVLHQLEAKKYQKVLEPIFQKFYKLVYLSGRQFFEFLKSALKELNIFYKTCFMVFYVD